MEHVITATHGTITKIDKTAKTIAVKTADGSEHIFYWAKDTSVHGAKAADQRRIEQLDDALKALNGFGGRRGATGKSSRP